MATVILNHRVEDYKKWRPVFDSDNRRRNDAGMKNVRVFRSADDWISYDGPSKTQSQEIFVIFTYSKFGAMFS